MARLSEFPESTFTALERIRETALMRFDSLFTPGLKLWTLENLRQFHFMFVGRFDEGEGSFLEKWRKQLEGATDEIFQLAAELLYTQQFFTSLIGPEKKLENVRAVLNWCKTPPPLPKWAEEGAQNSRLAADRSFNQHRPFHLAWLIEYLIHWQQLQEDKRTTLLDDPWAFAQDVRAVEFSRGAYQPMQEAWLYLMFPDSFENISSRNHKQRIREAFQGRLPNGASDNIDLDLFEIRNTLTSEYGNGFAFYRSPLAEQWRKIEPDQSDVEETLQSQITRQDILDAVKALDRGESHPFGPSTFYDLLEGGRRYPPKAVVGLAARRALGRILRPDEFSGGQESWAFRLLRDRGFQIVDKEAKNSVQKGLEEFLAVYLSVRASVAFGHHEQLKTLLNRLRHSLELLPALKTHPRIRVSWSVGQGKWAFVPWIALMDERETTSTQQGLYCVYFIHRGHVWRISDSESGYYEYHSGKWPN